MSKSSRYDPRLTPDTNRLLFDDSVWDVSYGALLLLCLVLAIGATLVLSACTISPNRATAKGIYPDASTPIGLNEYNGGIIDDITLNGRGYNVVTPNLAAKVQKWQGNQNGFVKVDYKSQSSYFPATDGVPPGYYQLWAVDKGVMFKYDSQ